MLVSIGVVDIPLFFLKRKKIYYYYSHSSPGRLCSHSRMWPRSCAGVPIRSRAFLASICELRAFLWAFGSFEAQHWQHQPVKLREELTVDPFPL